MAADKRVLGMYNNQPGQIAAGDTALVGVGVKQSLATGLLTIGSGLGNVTIDVGAPGAPGVPSAKKLVVTADMDVNGIETVIGYTVLESDVQLGDTAADRITMLGRFGTAGAPDFVFSQDVGHGIYPEQPTGPTTPGLSLVIRGGDAISAGPAMPGGQLELDSGNPAGGGAASVSIGGTYATTIYIAQSAVPTYLYGLNQLGTTASDYTNFVGYIDSDITFRYAAYRNISVEAAPASTAGINLSVYGGYATGPGNHDGGALVLDSGLATGTGTAGVAIGSPGNAQSITLCTGGGTSRLDFDNIGNITIQAGALLTTSGTGNINLPVNVNAKFQIEGFAVSGTNLTAANFDKMWDGSVVAATLHTHAGMSGSDVESTENSLSALDKGMAVRLTFSGANRFVDKQDATDDTSKNAYTFGLAKATIGLPGSVDLVCFGPCDTLDSAWDAAPVAADIGKPVYGSTTTIGLLSLAPSDSAGWTTRIGYVYFASATADTAVVYVHPGEVINNNPP